MEDAVGLIDGSERDITGAILDPIFTTALSKLKMLKVENFILT